MPFQFKNFALEDKGAAMKLGEDAVLLGAWAPIEAARVQGSVAPKFLDVGTGSGILALMLAQRFPKAIVQAIENEPNAAIQAQENFAASPFAERLQVTRVSLQDFQADQRFDAIICNPPFFLANDQIHNQARKHARQAATLTLDDLFIHAARLLKPNGSLSLILPCLSMVTAIEQFYPRSEKTQLWLNEAIAIFSSSEATQPKRVLQHYVNACPNVPCAVDLLRLDRESTKVRALVTDFYMNH